MTTSTGGRLMQTPEIEPLTIRPEEQARNVVDLIHRSVERYPAREAMRWKLRKADRPEGDDASRMDEPDVPAAVGLGHRASRSGYETSASRTATASRSSPGPGPSGPSPTLPRSRSAR